MVWYSIHMQNTYLDESIEKAEESLVAGNYPVGAVLVIDDILVGSKSNSGETSKSYINHAETSLIIEHAEEMLAAAQRGGTIELYSTLEPCLMCLGVAVMNKVHKIVNIQTDPRAGACHIDVMSMGTRYQEVWPEIVQYADYSDRPLGMIKTFLHKQIDAGIRVQWCKDFLALLEQNS